MVGRRVGVCARLGSLGVAMLMVIGVVGVTDRPAEALDDDVPEWLADLVGLDLLEVSGRGFSPDELDDLARGSGDVAQAESEGTEAAEAIDLPAPGVWRVALPGSGDSAEVIVGDGGPVELVLGDGSADVAGSELEIEVFDEVVAQGLNVSAFAFQVSQVAGPAAAEAPEEAPDIDEESVGAGSEDGDISDEVDEPVENDDLGESDEGGADAIGDEAVEETTDETDATEASASEHEFEPDGDADAVGETAHAVDGVDVDDSVGVFSQMVDGDDEGLPVELVIDYSGFAELHGGNFADRLQVVAFPDCVLDDPLPLDCDPGGLYLSTTVDWEAQQLEVDVADLAGLAGGVETDGVTLEDMGLTREEVAEAQGQLGGGYEDGGIDDAVGDVSAVEGGEGRVLFGVSSSPSGDLGSYAATDLGGAGGWQVTPGSGEFSYAYDVDVPAPAAGEAPSVGLSYSSGAVDGRTNATNPQAASTGVGWSDYTDAYIERSYDPCLQSGGTPASPDLCWKHHNGTISLEGISGGLLPLDADYEEWRVTGDAGWKVERFEGADNGTHGGEYWRVTAVDGTEYYFGLGENPDTGESTESALRVPVVSDNEDEPCRDENALHICHMGWRWHLDRIVDPDGNVTTYNYGKGVNGYAPYRGAVGVTDYDRSAVLTDIEYGAREGSNDPPAARVVFGRQYRCVDLNSNCTRPSGSSSSGRYLDTPTDLMCEPGASSCSVVSPSFFSTTRYNSIRTEVYVDGDWLPVAQHNLQHVFGGRVYDNPNLYLRSVQQHGLSEGGWIMYEPTEMNHEWLPNRVDVSDTDGEAAMMHARVNRVTSPFGGTVSVTYGQNRPCEPDHNPAFWQDNVRDCFPQSTEDDNERRTGVFHKYLALEVTEDSQDGGPPIVTEYEYEGDPAWGFDYSSFARYEHEWGWSNWRGYGTTTIRNGDAIDRVRVFRGLDGDLLWLDCGGGTFGPCGERSESVESFDGSTTATDHAALAGRVMEQASLGELDGVSNTVVQSTLHEYERRVTHEADSDLMQGRDAEWADVATITESVATAPGEFRQQGTETTYNDRLQPESTLELGWLDEDDRRCSITTYAVNEDAWMFEYPASNVTRTGDCDSGEVLSVSETYYDGSDTLGEVSDRGNATRQRSQVDDDTWAETSTEYDDLGRPVRVVDANGHEATTSYTATPANAVPAQVTETNELGHSTTTDYIPQLGAPVQQEGVNGEVTTWEYDAMGRLTEVWLPTEQDGDNPSSRFTYHPETERRMVMSASLSSDAGAEPIYDATLTFHDGFWREHQVHVPSPGEGLTIVTETTYDEQGRVANETGAQALPSSPTFQPVDVPSADWDNRTRYVYDDQGRVVREEAIQHDEVVHEVSYDFGYDHVTVTGPDGHQAREYQDGYGRTVAVEERDGDDWVSSSYDYDTSGNITAVIDPEGNTINYSYNMMGWKLSQDDPNRGTASFGYDDAGQQVWVEDGLGNQVHTAYDPLGRPTERRAGTSDGELLASWEYDSAPGGIGFAHRETRHSEDGDWVSETLGYDARGRSEGTTLTVPDSLPGLSGEYTVTQSYDLADRVTSVTYPEIGGLPEETIDTTYDDLGLVRQMAGLEQYVWAVDYDDRARPTSAGYGPFQDGEPWLAQQWEYNNQQMLRAMETWVADSAAGGTVSRHELAYDDAGNLADRLTSQNGQEWRECYDHDDRQRLVESYTVDADDDCADGTPGDGDQPFQHSYNYSADGNLLERVDDGDTYNYSYPAPGGDLPHAPTAVNDDTYTWDANGNLTERTVDGAIEQFDWDIEQHLASVEGDDGTTEFTYGPGGERLLRATDDATTLYLGNHEITAYGDGSVVSGVRSYTFGGDLVATRTSDDGTAYMVSDQAGSVELEIETEGDVTASRAYDPYGNVREQDGEMATDQGFVGQIEDPTTNLSYLNARYYDTTIGVFISTDPIYDTDRIKTLNPYTYGAGNPTTYSDPEGLSPSYIYGIERENRTLRTQNQGLRGNIAWLNNQIEGLQNIIQRQNRDINRLITTVRAMDGIIRQQQAHIHRLETAVRRLQRIVAAQQVEIQRLRATVRRQQQIIRQQQATIQRQQIVINRQAATITYYKGVVNEIVDHTWGGGIFRNVIAARVKSSIHAGRGVPSGAYQLSNVTQLQGQVAGLRSDLSAAERASRSDARQIGRLGRQNNRLERENNHLSSLAGALETLETVREQCAASSCMVSSESALYLMPPEDIGYIGDSGGSASLTDQITSSNLYQQGRDFACLPSLVTGAICAAEDGVERWTDWFD